MIKNVDIKSNWTAWPFYLRDYSVKMLYIWQLATDKIYMQIKVQSKIQFNIRNEQLLKNT